jgi:hypothetical protein
VLGNVRFVSLIEKDLREVGERLVHQVVVLEDIAELCRWFEITHSRYLRRSGSRQI